MFGGNRGLKVQQDIGIQVIREVVTASDSNTTPTTQVTWNNNGTAACLQSKKPLY